MEHEAYRHVPYDVEVEQALLGAILVDNRQLEAVTQILKAEHFDYLIFGHRHLPIDFSLGESRYINLGDWIRYDTYAVFDGQQLSLLAQSPSMDQKIIRK